MPLLQWNSADIDKVSNIRPSLRPSLTPRPEYKIMKKERKKNQQFSRLRLQ
jgi:hypothetical protein